MLTLQANETPSDEWPRAVSETGPSVEELVAKSRAGCSSAFEQLVSHFEERIYGYLFQITRNVHDAEDLTQVPFIKAYRNLRNFAGTHAFAPWLFTIAKRTALNHLRGLRHTEELCDEDRIEREDPATNLESKDEQANVWAVARRLPYAQHEAIW